MIRKLIIQDKKKSSEIKVDGRIKNFSLKKKKVVLCIFFIASVKLRSGTDKEYETQMLH